MERDGDRDESVIVGTFQDRFQERFKGLAKVQASICIDNDMAVIPETRSNIYHAEIFENINKEPLTQLKALILADNSQIVVYNPEVKWV